MSEKVEFPFFLNFLFVFVFVFVFVSLNFKNKTKTKTSELHGEVSDSVEGPALLWCAIWNQGTHIAASDHHGNDEGCVHRSGGRNEPGSALLCGREDFVALPSGNDGVSGDAD